MSKLLKSTFLIHAVVGVLSGAPLLIAPGRFLQWIGWAPIDPIISRVLGAGLLALAWSSFRGWRATERAQVAILVEMEAVFTVLGCVGVLRHLLSAPYPLMVWIVFAILAIFAIAWIASLLKK
ncbi:MAG: hypothetical protein ACETWB_05330 [Anaerolineae bacterium]